jgi:hypothetical protein
MIVQTPAAKHCMRMNYAPLGTTGLEVSKLALGAMTFGRGFHGIAKVDQSTATEIVTTAIARGGQLFCRRRRLLGWRR